MEPYWLARAQVEVIRFAVDAVRAEAFNPRTLFLFGSYTIGKERLFLEVARQLRMKVLRKLRWAAPPQSKSAGDCCSC